MELTYLNAWVRRVYKLVEHPEIKDVTFRLKVNYKIMNFTIKQKSLHLKFTKGKKPTF